MQAERWRFERRVVRNAMRRKSASASFRSLQGHTNGEKGSMILRDKEHLAWNSLALLLYPGILSPMALTCSKSQSPKISISDTRICGRLGAIVLFGSHLRAWLRSVVHGEKMKRVNHRHAHAYQQKIMMQEKIHPKRTGDSAIFIPKRKIKARTLTRTQPGLASPRSFHTESEWIVVDAAPPSSLIVRHNEAPSICGDKGVALLYHIR